MMMKIPITTNLLLLLLITMTIMMMKSTTVSASANPPDTTAPTTFLRRQGFNNVASGSAQEGSASSASDVASLLQTIKTAEELLDDYLRQFEEPAYDDHGKLYPADEYGTPPIVEEESNDF